MMARPLSGSVTRRGKAWRASVPRLDDPTRRLETTFPNEDVAWAWVEAQLARREEGLAPQLPKRTSQVPSHASTTTFTQVASLWFYEHYVALQRAGGERACGVERDMEMHVIPAFRDLFDCQVIEGRARVIDWLRTMAGWAPLQPNSTYAIGLTTYEHTTMVGMLWIVKQIIAHARAIGVDVPDYARDLVALERAGSIKRVGTLVTLEETQRLAMSMHWIHQLVLWTMRLGGLRISEVYGLAVENFGRDEGGDAFLRVENQGGRTFLEWGKDGQIEASMTKKGTKTGASYRIVLLAAPLAELFEFVLNAYHVDDEGCLDLKARLIPPLQSEVGGQGGFRDALKRAVVAAGLVPDDGDLEDWIVSHDLRKSFGSDLAWDDTVTPLKRRRALGHRAGSDVTDLVYTMDPRLKSMLAAIPRALEAELERAGIVTLMTPTSLRPLYGKVWSASQIQRVEAELAAVGWLVPESSDTISVAEAAALLGFTEKHTRRLLGDHIAAIKQGTQWRLRVEDVLAFRDRNEGKWLLREVAELTGVNYRTVHRALATLNITAAHDTFDERILLLDEGQVGQLKQHFEREQRLDEVAVTRSRAAAQLGVGVSTVDYLVKSGYLAQWDGAAAGEMRVTVASLEEELGRRRRRARAIAG